jgi:hypothetical protein
MPDTSSHAFKLVAGALVLGGSFLTTNAALTGIASGIGLEWTAEGLGGLGQSAFLARFFKGSPLAKAFERAVRNAARELRRTYANELGPRGDQRAFGLLDECARFIAEAEIPEGTFAASAERALRGYLDDLLFGHESADWIKPRLLPAVARELQRELQADEDAWRAFHGALLQELPAKLTSVGRSVDDLRLAIDALQEPSRVPWEKIEAALHETTDRMMAKLDALQIDVRRLAERAPPDVPLSTVFDNRGMTAGSVKQVGGNDYKDSAHTEGAGKAVVIVKRS